MSVVGSTWTRNKLQADALLRFHNQPGVLQQVREVLQFWALHVVPKEARAQAALALVAKIAGDTASAEVRLVSWLKTKAPKTEGRTPMRAYLLLRSRVPPDLVTFNPAFDVDQVLLPVAFGARGVLSKASVGVMASHMAAAKAASAAADVDEEEDTLALADPHQHLTAMCSKLALADTLTHGTCICLVPELGISARLVSAQLRHVPTAHLVRKAYQLGFFGTTRTIAFPFDIDCSQLVLNFAKHVDCKLEESHTYMDKDDEDS